MTNDITAMSYDELIGLYRQGHVDRRALLRGLAALAAPAIGAKVIAESAISAPPPPKRKAPARQYADYQAETGSRGGGNTGFFPGSASGGGNANDEVMEDEGRTVYESEDELSASSETGRTVFRGEKHGNSTSGTAGETAEAGNGQEVFGFSTKTNPGEFISAVHEGGGSNEGEYTSVYGRETSLPPHRNQDSSTAGETAEAVRGQEVFGFGAKTGPGEFTSAVQEGSGSDEGESTSGSSTEPSAPWPIPEAYNEARPARHPGRYRERHPHRNLHDEDSTHGVRGYNPRTEYELLPAIRVIEEEEYRQAVLPAPDGGGGNAYLRGWFTGSIYSFDEILRLGRKQDEGDDESKDVYLPNGEMQPMLAPFIGAENPFLQARVDALTTIKPLRER